MPQVVRRTPIKTMLARPEFLQGFKDAMSGVGFYEKYDQMPVSGQLAYERGRHFFFAAGHMRIKQGRGVSRDAIEVYNELRSENTLI